MTAAPGDMLSLFVFPMKEAVATATADAIGGAHPLRGSARLLKWYDNARFMYVRTTDFEPVRDVSTAKVRAENDGHLDSFMGDIPRSMLWTAPRALGSGGGCGARLLAFSHVEGCA